MDWDLVIWDCDGVLVDSEGIASQVMAAAATAAGWPMSVDEAAREFTGRTMPDCVALIESRLGHAPAADFAERVQSARRRAFERDLQAVPGVGAVLDGLAVPICVASNGSRQMVEFSLAVTGLLPRFAGRIFTAADVPRGKPFPDLFLLAARKLGARPEATAVIEDGVFGVEAALAAGMSAFGYSAAGNGQALRSAGARVFERMAELPALFARAPSRSGGRPRPRREGSGARCLGLAAGRDEPDRR